MYFECLQCNVVVLAWLWGKKIPYLCPVGVSNINVFVYLSKRKLYVQSHCFFAVQHTV